MSKIVKRRKVFPKVSSYIIEYRPNQIIWFEVKQMAGKTSIKVKTANEANRGAREY